MRKSLKREIEAITNSERRAVKDGIVTVVTEHGTYSYPVEHKPYLLDAAERAKRTKITNCWDENFSKMIQSALYVLYALNGEQRKVFKDWVNNTNVRYPSQSFDEIRQIERRVSRYYVPTSYYREAFERLPKAYAV